MGPLTAAGLWLLVPCCGLVILLIAWHARVVGDLKRTVQELRQRAERHRRIPAKSPTATTA